jgi:signal peptidase I
LALLAIFAALHFSLIGNVQLKTVVSGSMEPTIQTGSVVVIDSAPSAINAVGVGDVITYNEPGSTERIVTHRVVGVEPGGFITQGDANQSTDRYVVASSDIIGTVQNSVPYAGYAAKSIYTPVGLSMLVIVPTILVIFTELKNIRRNIKRLKLPAYVVPPKESIGSKLPTFLTLLVGFMLLSSTATMALFSATAVSSDNRFAAADIFLADSVVINEVYYNVADDKQGPSPNIARYQWIELYNPTNESVQLQGYRICASDWCRTIQPNVSLAPGEFALLSHDHNIWPRFWDSVHRDTLTINLGGPPYNELDLSADMLTLVNNEAELIDFVNWGVPDDSWDNFVADLWNPGVVTAEQGSSLERIYTGGIANSPDDWQDNPSPTPGQ